MLLLCKILDISINDLFSAKVVDMKDKEKMLEKNLLEMTKMKEKVDKELLSMEVFLIINITIILLTCVFVVSFVNMTDWLRVSLIIVGIILFVIGIKYTIRIEQIAGYYECDKCHYKYIPSYKSVFFAQHINRARKMKCPKCKKKTWHKKVLTK